MTLINDLIEELREMPNGTETTVYHLIEKCGYDANKMEQDDELLTVYGDLLKAARKAHIILDWSAHRNMADGLPYHIPFVVSNTRAQIKCPRCGSHNTARILYGMPAFSKELEAKLDAGKIHLGGCCISDVDAKVYCNDCKKEFGAEAQFTKAFEIEVLTDIVTEIRFYRQEARSPFEESLYIKKTKDGACVNASGYSKALPFKNEYDISNKKWFSLVDTLYNRLYLNDWKHHFEDPFIMDGEEWTLTVKLIGNRTRKYAGLNGYPPYWKELIKLLRPYLRLNIKTVSESSN